MVAAFNLQQLYGDTYSQALKKPARKSSRLAIYTGIGFGILVFLQMAIISLVFWYGGSMVLDGEMQLEQLLIVFLSVWMAVFGLMMGQMVFPDVAQANAAVQKVFGIVDRTPKVRIISPAAFAHVMFPDGDSPASLLYNVFRAHLAAQPLQWSCACCVYRSQATTSWQVPEASLSFPLFWSRALPGAELLWNLRTSTSATPSARLWRSSAA